MYAFLHAGYIVIRYVRQSGYLEHGGSSTTPHCLDPLVRLFVIGSEETINDTIEAAATAEGTSGGSSATPGSKSSLFRQEVKRALTLLFCFIGLQVSYLTWGVLQEKIMTRTYRSVTIARHCLPVNSKLHHSSTIWCIQSSFRDSVGNEGQFKDSQFLVFVNRVLAFAIALLYITLSQQPRHRAPLFKYSYCSLSNIMSSWCQYEALKFVSFPTQVNVKKRQGK